MWDVCVVGGCEVEVEILYKRGLEPLFWFWDCHDRHQVFKNVRGKANYFTNLHDILKYNFNFWKTNECRLHINCQSYQMQLISAGSQHFKKK